MHKLIFYKYGTIILSKNHQKDDFVDLNKIMMNTMSVIPYFNIDLPVTPTRFEYMTTAHANNGVIRHISVSNIPTFSLPLFQI